MRVARHEAPFRSCANELGAPTETAEVQAHHAGLFVRSSPPGAAEHSEHALHLSEASVGVVKRGLFRPGPRDGVGCASDGLSWPTAASGFSV